MSRDDSTPPAHHPNAHPHSPVRLPDKLAQELLSVIEASLRAAGDILRDDLYREGGPRGAEGHADADSEAEEVMRALIRAAFPEHDIVGEEGSGDRHESPFQWQLDPNDGTAAYLKGYRGSSVSVGVLHHGEPIAGGVFAFAYPHDDGDLIIGGVPEVLGETFGGVRRNGALCPHPAPVAELAQAYVATSQAADSASAVNVKLIAPARYLSVPSIAYRLALAAVDEVQAGVSVAAPTTWDVAGGHALLLAQGRDLWIAPGQRFTYGSSGGHSSVCAGGDPTLCAHLLGLNLRAPLSQPDPQRDQKPYPLAQPSRVKSGRAEGLKLARAQGALIGAMAGDALGSLVEFQWDAQIRDRYPDGVREMADGGTFNKIAGQVTDDSEMAIALARSILSTGRYQTSEAAVAYAEWLASNPFDLGNTTRASLSPALSALSDGVSPDEVLAIARHNTDRESQANGALMRITPLAIWGAGADLSDAELAELARADASITHTHQVCRDANAVYVLAQRYAIVAPRAPREVYDYALDWAQRTGVEASVIERLERAPRHLPRGASGWVLNAFEMAFCALLHDSYEEAIPWAISYGEDTDTNAMIVGGLLGAVHGLDAIPPAWTRAVITSRPHFDLGRGRCVRPKWLWSCDALLLAESLLDA